MKYQLSKMFRNRPVDGVRNSISVAVVSLLWSHVHFLRLGKILDRLCSISELTSFESYNKGFYEKNKLTNLINFNKTGKGNVFHSQVKAKYNKDNINLSFVKSSLKVSVNSVWASYISKYSFDTNLYNKNNIYNIIFYENTK